jgi:hypothetical protein
MKIHEHKTGMKQQTTSFQTRLRHIITDTCFPYDGSQVAAQVPKELAWHLLLDGNTAQGANDTN